MLLGLNPLLTLNHRVLNLRLSLCLHLQLHESLHRILFMFILGRRRLRNIIRHRAHPVIIVHPASVHNTIRDLGQILELLRLLHRHL